jgi:hypothetical protein
VNERAHNGPVWDEGPEPVLPIGLELTITVTTRASDHGSGESGPDPQIETVPIRWVLTDPDGRVIAEGFDDGDQEPNWSGINGDPVQFLDHYLDEDEAKNVRHYLHVAGLY